MKKSEGYWEKVTGLNFFYTNGKGEKITCKGKGWQWVTTKTK